MKDMENKKKKQSIIIDWNKYTNFNNSNRALDPVTYIKELRKKDRMEPDYET